MWLKYNFVYVTHRNKDFGCGSNMINSRVNWSLYSNASKDMLGLYGMLGKERQAYHLKTN